MTLAGYLSSSLATGSRWPDPDSPEPDVDGSEISKFFEAPEIFLATEFVLLVCRVSSFMTKIEKLKQYWIKSKKLNDLINLNRF